MSAIDDLFTQDSAAHSGCCPPPCSASSGKFDVIYADPPWSYYNDMTVTPRENKTGGGSMKHPQYPVMSSQDIKRLPIESIAADDSILFIWTTDYHMAKAMDVIRSWGFEYKTVGFAWQKTNKQGSPVCFMGAYTMKTGIEFNPPPISDANRVADFLRDRKGTISRVIDIAEPRYKVVTTWVLRHSVKGRCDQFDLYKNGDFILTGGNKRCAKAMAPEYFPILRYD